MHDQRLVLAGRSNDAGFQFVRAAAGPARPRSEVPNTASPPAYCVSPAIPEALRVLLLLSAARRSKSASPRFSLLLPSHLVTVCVRFAVFAQSRSACTFRVRNHGHGMEQVSRSHYHMMANITPCTSHISRASLCGVRKPQPSILPIITQCHESSHIVSKLFYISSCMYVASYRV